MDIRAMEVEMTRDFVKGVALGAATSALVLAASAAVAGTGVGGVFNLGKTNSVSKPTILNSHTSGAALKLTNAGSGRALGLKVTRGAPFTVNSSTKVANLNADKLDGSDALASRGSVDLGDIVDPDQRRASLGSIAGLGTFTVGGAVLGPGEDCDVTFTNTSGAAVVINGAANPGLADGASIELAGTGSRPDGISSMFSIVTASATTVVSGQVNLNYGFPSGNNTCAGAVQALVTR